MNASGIIMAALVSGYLGGILGSRNMGVSAASSVRASRFELVNAEGKTTALLEADEHGESHLRFLGRGSRAALEVGLSPNGKPFMKFSGADFKKRVVLELDQSDRPVFGMGDGKWEGRVQLGFLEPDSVDSLWDRWGLTFMVPGSGIPVASIGVIADEGRPKGFLSISGERIR